MARILVVDPESAAREVLSEKLKSQGHDVTEAESTEAAMKACKAAGRQPFDLLMIECELGRDLGTDLYNRLKAMGNKTPVVFTSGRNDTEHMRMILSVTDGVKFLPKPFGDHDLMRTLTASLQKPRRTPGHG